MSLVMKQGDRYPSFETVLHSSIDFNLADAVAVTFVWRPKGGVTRHEGEMVVVDAPAKRVRFNWTSEATASVGTFEAQIEIEFAGGRMMTIPNAGFYEFSVAPTI